MNLLRFNPIIDFNESELNSLTANRFGTITGFLTTESSAISRATKIDIKKIKANQAKLLDHYSTPLQNLAQLWDDLSDKRSFYSTGCPRLDEMLEGGLLTGEIVQITGSTGSGKTQFSHHMALQVALQGQEALFIDTDGSFSADRLSQMYDETGPGQDLDKEQALKKIHVISIFGLYKLLAFLDKLIVDLKQPNGLYKGVKLIVLDSYVNPFVDVLEYQQASCNIRKKKALIPIASSYNRSLRTLTMIRPDIALLTTNITSKFFSCLWNNNCGLILSIKVLEDGIDIRQFTCIQSERVLEGKSCEVKLVKAGFLDVIAPPVNDVEI